MDYKQEQLFRMQQAYNGTKTPYYMTYPMQNLYLTEIEYERDMERMKELYPNEAKALQKLVEEECDKMEYDGSLMFDEYPDKVMLRRVCNSIYQKAKNTEDSGTVRAPGMHTAPEMPGNMVGDRMPGNMNSEMLDDVPGGEDGMEAMGRGPGLPPLPPGTPPPPGPGILPPPRNDGLMDLIEVLLYNEMYKRRCRNRRCRRWW